MPREHLEENLYEPIVQTLKSRFDYWYLNRSYLYGGKLNDEYRPQSNLSTAEIKNPFLQITARNDFSEEIKSHFDIIMFGKLYGEELRPDIMGYVTKEEGAKPELIIIEVKLGDLKIIDVMQARLYELFFKSKFTFLLSPTGMVREKIEAVMQHDKFLRGNVIIGKCGENGKDFVIDPKLKDKLPKELRNFQRFCKL